MLVAKKINRQKAMVLFAIAALMMVGIFYFIYKNYTLTNKSYTDTNIVQLESISIKKDNPDPEKNSVSENAAAEIGTASAQPAKPDFFSNSKWTALKRTNYVFPEKTATGTDNPFGEKYAQ
jgi:hypothetical protein